MELALKIVKESQKYKALCDKDQIQFDKLVFEIFQLEKDNNQNQNQTLNLAITTIEQLLNSFIDNHITLWRFICLPEIFLAEHNNTWDYHLNNKRYDTFTPSISNDIRIQNIFKKYFQNITFYLVIDEWEAPLVRDSKRFDSLNLKDRQNALLNLQSLQKDIIEWIGRICENPSLSDLNYKYLFFSDILDYNSFESLVKQLKVINQDDSIIDDITEFHLKDKNQNWKSQEEIRAMSKNLYAQYALEALFISNFLQQSIFLNSEYPTQIVTRMLTKLISFPIIYYSDEKTLITL